MSPICGTSESAVFGITGGRAGNARKEVFAEEEAQMALFAFYANETLTSHEMTDDAVSTNSNQTEPRTAGVSQLGGGEHLRQQGFCEEGVGMS